MNKSTARSRWQIDEAANRAKIISKILLKGHSVEQDLSQIADRTEQGMLDLRGIPLQLRPGAELRGTQIRDIDFSYADLGHVVLKQCIFEHVIFREIENSRWNERGCRFTDIDFTKAKLRDSAIGIDGSVYKRICFHGVDFTGASFYRPQFIDCDFSYARLRNLDFYVSNFVNCKFRGKLESVWFRRHYPFANDEQKMGKAAPNEMRNVDFSEANLWDLVFTGGLDLSRVVLPQDGSHILLHHLDTSLKKVRHEIEKMHWSDDEKKGTFIWIDALLVHAINQPMWILNKNEVGMQLGGKASQEILGLLQAFDSSDS